MLSFGEIQSKPRMEECRGLDGETPNGSRQQPIATTSRWQARWQACIIMAPAGVVQAFSLSIDVHGWFRSSVFMRTRWPCK